MALEAGDAECSWDGVECRDGVPTGRLAPEAAERVRQVIPDKPMERRLAEARAALERLAGHGVTTIHDITGPEQMRVFQELRRRGELTVRVYETPECSRNRPGVVKKSSPLDIRAEKVYSPFAGSARDETRRALEALAPKPFR